MCIDFKWHLLYSYNRDFFAPIFPTSSIVFMNTMQSLMTWYFHEASSEVFRSVTGRFRVSSTTKVKIFIDIYEGNVSVEGKRFYTQPPFHDLIVTQGCTLGFILVVGRPLLRGEVIGENLYQIHIALKSICLIHSAFSLIKN